MKDKLPVDKLDINFLSLCYGYDYLCKNFRTLKELFVMNKIARVYIMTDLEGVAGVIDSENWCHTDSRYYEMAKEFLFGIVRRLTLTHP